MHPALFQLDGTSFVPTELTRGGWSDAAQHGSPPSGLLARAVEAVPHPVPMQVVRFTIDLFRQVPLVPLQIETDVRRSGRRIQVVEARLMADGRTVAQAVALKIRTADVELPGAAGERLDPGPEQLDTLEWRNHFGPDDGQPRFHTDGVEIRTVGDSFVRAEPGRSWFRLRYPLLPNESLTPFQLAATMADLSNGNAQALDPRQWLYVNADNTLYLDRLPAGEWLGMYSEAHQRPNGIGITDTTLFDRQGRIGRINQAQLLEPR